MERLNYMGREGVYKTLLAAQAKAAESLWVLLLDINRGSARGGSAAVPVASSGWEGELSSV